MAEKKKMTVAEILAAARKADSGGGASDAPTAPSASASPAAEVPAAPKATPAKVPAKGEGRPSVADILAMAKGGAAKPAAAKPAAEKPAAKPAAEKSAAKPAAAKAEAKPVAVARDTASILAAARKDHKPGPMSKAEAEKQQEAAAKGGKPAVVVPPMPTRPAYATPASKAAVPAKVEERRFFVAAMSAFCGSFLAIGFSSLAVTLGMWTLGFARFMFPNILREPPSRFKVGFPADFPPGYVEEKFKAKFGVWVVNSVYDGKQQIYALQSICTHLGCTPNWLEAEQKFKCPCHGSGFYKEGINFEGPAPRPLERYAIRISDDGQIEIDKSKTFQQEMGGWEDSTSYVSV